LTNAASTGLVAAALVGAGLFWAGTVTAAQSSRTEAIAERAETYFAAHAANGDFSGQVVIARHGEIVYEGAFGLADVESGVAVTMDTRFVIASITKTMTAAAILGLERDGKLDLNDPLAKFVPDYPQADAITPRLMLLFASGIGNPDFDALSVGPRLTSEELVRHLAGRALTFLPGTNSQYSNGNYNVLARLIEITTKSSYGDALKTAIFTPLKMNDTEDGSVATVIDRLAAGHTPGPGKDQMVSSAAPRLDLSIGSGALVSTARDVARWGHAVVTKRFFDLSALEYPYGWGRTSDHGTTGFEQTGATNGYMSVLRVHPEEGWVIAVLANTEYGQWNQWGSQMTRLIFKNVIEMPDRRPGAMQLTERQLANAVGRYRKGERFMDIRAADGHLWLHMDGYPTGKFMARLGDSNRFDIRADFLDVEFDILEAGPASTMTTIFPNGSDIYERVGNTSEAVSGPATRTVSPR
jgi:CubicO group peptidase (beta-lactamase class C family)